MWVGVWQVTWRMQLVHVTYCLLKSAFAAAIEFVVALEVRCRCCCCCCCAAWAVPAMVLRRFLVGSRMSRLRRFDPRPR